MRLRCPTPTELPTVVATFRALVSRWADDRVGVVVPTTIPVTSAKTARSVVVAVRLMAEAYSTRLC